MKTSFKISKVKGKNQLQVYAINAEKPNERTRKSISKLLRGYKTETDLEYWEDDKQQFKTEVKKGIVIPTAKEDNKRITELMNALEELCENDQYTYRNVLDVYSKQNQCVKEETKVPTLLEYSRIYTEMVRTHTRNDAEKDNKDTNNWRIYANVVHKLEGTYKGKKQPWADEIKRFASQPINEITSKDFNEFIKFLETHKMTNANLVTNFKTIVYYYRKKVMKDSEFILTKNDESTRIYNKMKEPKYNTIILSDNQLKQLAGFDVTLAMPNEREERKTMYKDVLLLLYLLYSRPIDVVCMRIEDINFGNYKTENLYWTYKPEKMPNESDKKSKSTPITPDALKIIEKYKGSRTYGYVFPFHELKDDNAKRTTKLKRVNKICEPINKFVKAVGKYYQWNIKKFDKLVIYSMRRTSINNGTRSGIPADQLETIAHTSVREIKKVYQDSQYIAENIPTEKLNSLPIAV